MTVIFLSSFSFSFSLFLSRHLISQIKTKRPISNHTLFTPLKENHTMVTCLNTTTIYTSTCNPSTPCIYKTIPKNKLKCNTKYYVFSVKAYMEDSSTVSGFVRKVIGSLPVVGLIARIVSDEGGLGGDTIDFAEFRRRVGKKCSVNDSRAFFEFKERRGKVGEPLYVLMCCWLAAVGAGLLKSEEILEGVARLRISDDIEFEEETFLSLIKEANEKRAKVRAPTPTVPMEIRAEKALDAIYVCCFGRDLIEEDDERLLCTILTAVFPSVGEQEIKRIINNKARKVAEGGENDNFQETKLSKEAVKAQMKDLEFLRQQTQT